MATSEITDGSLMKVEKLTEIMREDEEQFLCEHLPDDLLDPEIQVKEWKEQGYELIVKNIGEYLVDAEMILKKDGEIIARHEMWR